MWEAGQPMMRTAAPEAFADVTTADQIITAEREEALETAPFA